MQRSNFLPTSKKDIALRGWKECDIILISGDAYVDHPSYGTAVIGRVLENAGFKVGILAQPDWKKNDDFLKLGRPKLFFGITAGNLDSMVSNYSANKMVRKSDEYSPGGKSGFRPNRATIVYANKVRECFPGAPIVIGGIEASLRRLAHYDYWTDEIRRSLLLDTKADILVYGMGEKPVTEIARRLKNGESIKTLSQIRGTVVARSNLDDLKDYVLIPSYEEVKGDKQKFNEAFKIYALENDPVRGKTIVQKHADRFVIQFPPAIPLSTPEMDQIYGLPYERNWHPAYDQSGGVPGFETVRFSIISHRGCSGDCSFCSLTAHQGRIIQSRSKTSILEEVENMAASKGFRGTITDIGGPTANLYEAACKSWELSGTCRNKQCLYPEKCENFELGYEKTVELWNEVMQVPGVKHLFISSGLRYDLLVDQYSDSYLATLCEHHISGQLKIAPEHVVASVLSLMNKSSIKTYEKFVTRYRNTNKALKRNQYLVNYFISAHPGTTLKDALEIALYLLQRNMQPEQIQDFIPLPMTLSACLYYTGKHPFTGERVYVAKDPEERLMQRALVQYKQPKNRDLIVKALRRLNRLDLRQAFMKAARRY